MAEGSVGGGTGTNCNEFKGGNGTASRRVSYGRRTFTVAAVVQAVEEAVLNALVVNDDMVGRDGHRSSALPHARLSALLGRRT